MLIDWTICNILEIWLRPFKYLFILILEKREHGYLIAGCDYLKNETCHLSFHTIELIYSWKLTSNYWTLCLLRQWSVYPHGYLKTSPTTHTLLNRYQLDLSSILGENTNQFLGTLFLYIIRVIILFYSMWTWRHF